MTASGCVWSTCARRDERVQQRLDRRPRLVGRERRSAAGSRPSSRRPSPRARAAAAISSSRRRGEARRRDRREVGARALDPEHALLAAGVVDRRPLGRGVAAALVGERAVGAEQVRAVDERRRATSSPRRAASSHRSSGAGMPSQHVGDCSCRAPRASATADGRREALPRLAASRRRPAARRSSARTSARTTSRASSSDASSPSAIACTSRLPSSVASSGPASTGRPAALAVHAAEQLVARAAADDVHLARAPCR